MRSIFPFYDIDKHELLKLSFNSNNECNCSSKIDNYILSEFPRFDRISSLNNVPQLSSFDPKINVPSKVNFKYFTPHQFHSSPEIMHSFSEKSTSVLHCNIRSISANHDKLYEMLNYLKYKFSIIGISEAWLTKSKENISNISIPGYDFISQPSQSKAGGVGFYVDNNIAFLVRSDLSSSCDEHDSLWIEIKNPGDKNILCAVVYRHHNSNLELFLKDMNQTLEKANQESKYCILMGDFNIDLLGVDSHSLSNDFINSLSSYLFQPHILQPTRITSHSATLIDNIFLNSFNHFTISGNLLYDISDHLPNFLILNSTNSYKCKEKQYKRDFSKLNYQTVFNEFQGIDWVEEFYGKDNINQVFDTIYCKVNGVINKRAPLIQRLFQRTQLLTF